MAVKHKKAFKMILTMYVEEKSLASLMLSSSVRKLFRKSCHFPSNIRKAKVSLTFVSLVKTRFVSEARMVELSTMMFH